MIDKHAFQKTCKSLSHRIKNARCGAVNVGGQHVLSFTIYGDSVIIDSSHFPSVQLCYLPSYKQISLLCLLDHLICPSMKCVDIGAGCGFYSLMLAALSGGDGQVYSFEGNFDYFVLLKRNILSNGYSSVFCVNWLENLDQYFNQSTIQLDFVHIALEEDLPRTFNGMKYLVETNFSLRILCHIDPLQMLQREDEYENLFQKLSEWGFEGYLLPSLDLLSTKEQLSQGSAVKSLFLSR